MISTGKRDRKVDILQRVETRGPSGDVRTDYAPRGRYWAYISPRSGRESFVADQDAPTWDTRLNIRYDKRVQATDKVVIDGVRHDIVLLNPLGRREELEILAVRSQQ